MAEFRFDPERKRRQLRKRGWSEKRIDAYLRHSTQFNTTKPQEKVHYRGNRE